MPLPRVLLAVPILIVAAGVVAPGFTSATSLPKGPNVVGMVQTDYALDTITLHKGDRLELVNNSNFLHVVTLGHNGRIEQERGAPKFGNSLGLVTMPHGTVYLTRPWNTPGVYQLTCILHAHMNLAVVVKGGKTSRPSRSRLVVWLNPSPAARLSARQLPECG